MTRHALWAFSLLTGAAAVQLWYINAGPAAPTWDDAWYLEIAFRLLNAAAEGPVSLAKTYAEAFRIKAPMISVLGAIVCALFGRSYTAALGVGTLSLIASGIYTFAAGRRLFGNLPAVLAVFFLNTMPLHYGLARNFYVEAPLTAAVSAWIYHCLASEGLSRRAHVWALGLWLGIGMLLKIIFPLYIAAPTAWLFYRWRQDKRLSPRFAEELKRVLALGGALALSWYAFNWLYAVGFALRASFGDIASHYSGGFALSPSTLFKYAHELTRQALSGYYAAYALALSVLWWARRRPKRLSDASIVILAWISLPLLATTLGVNKEIRYVGPILPGFALLLGALFWRVCGREPLCWGLAGILLFGPLDLFCFESFGRSVWDYGEHRVYNGPPGRAPGWDNDSFVRALGEHARKDLDVWTIMVGLEHRHFNANNLAYISARENLPLNFVNVGYAQNSAHRALIRMAEKNATHYLAVDGLGPEELPTFLNKANDGILELLASDRFRLVGTFSLRPDVRAHLFENIRHRARRPAALSSPNGEAS